MNLAVKSYFIQEKEWPPTGKVLLAHYDSDAVVVYQAYPVEIGHYAVAHGRFGGKFSFARMTWIKPNFTWMMYRSGWGRKSGQEVVLAIWLQRSAFERILSKAIPTSFRDYSGPGDFHAWRESLEQAEVLFQWDPDRDLEGNPSGRRALQLGLRGSTVDAYAHTWIEHIEDLTPFVREQHEMLLQGMKERILTPAERPYSFVDNTLSCHLGVSGE